MTSEPSTSVSLVLGGGGARGLAHVGAWRALQEEGIRVQRVAGSSVGALLAACIAAGMSWRELYERAQRLARSRIFSFDARILYRGTRSQGLLREEPLRALIWALLPVSRFDELQIPLSVNAVDLASGEVVWFGEGGCDDVSLVDAVYASCALPLLFPPALIDGRHYIDGGILDPLPIERAHALNGGKIVAVDLTANGMAPAADPGILDMYRRVFEILNGSRRSSPAVHPGIVIRIQPCLAGRGQGTFDLSRPDDLIDAGYQATMKRLTGRAPEPALVCQPACDKGGWFIPWIQALPWSLGLGRAAQARIGAPAAFQAHS